MQIKHLRSVSKPTYSKKTHKLSWKALTDGVVQVTLRNKRNGDVHIGYGRNIKEGIEAAIRQPAERPVFKNKTILRKSSK